ncbi:MULTISPECIES: LLM class flavin-dependent oxidoreductase [Amycolatopsis]|uniref:Luciferase-like domain-containing protein n=1 Tax=Amycolatopsis tucumanensis TaxID=401106 RepID=A0ABP7J480_9PSEU|nr:LLM class flavin-dependent oxidoreductase [Amycolatopsis tucumanensis]MCF6426270.1 LLM class flavin-dependent oxidoreductase [Amycolatopsis tucumanensis]
MSSVGVWLSGGNPVTAGVEREQPARIDELGYASVWMGETVGGRDAFARSAVFLGATGRITVGTGIANVWSRPAVTAQAAARTVAEAHPGRFVLGLGIGHPFQAASLGQSFADPLRGMRDYRPRTALHGQDELLSPRRELDAHPAKARSSVGQIPRVGTDAGPGRTFGHDAFRQLDAGADQVLISPTAADLPGAVDQLARLAPALPGVAA